MRWFSRDDDLAGEGLGGVPGLVGLRWAADALTGVQACYGVIPLGAVRQREDVQPRLRPGCFLARWPHSSYGRPQPLGEAREPEGPAAGGGEEPEFIYEFS